jgi:C1A family cysteine protease
MAMKVLQKQGISPEPLDIYDITKYNDKPGFWAYQFARFWKIKVYQRCIDINALKTALACKEAVWLGVPVQQSIIANKGDVIFYDKTQPPIGGHAMAVCGYSSKDKEFMVCNSWGKTWGEAGFGYISESYLTDVPWLDIWSFTI